MASRSTISAELKRDVVEKILRGEMTVSEAVKAHKVHPYQVQAWIGQMTLGEGVGRKFSITPGGVRRTKSGVTAAPAPALVDLLSGDDGDDPVRAIGEWYIRTVILKETGHKPPPGVKPVKD